VILDDTALQRLLGPIRKTAYPEGVQQTIAAVPVPARARAA